MSKITTVPASILTPAVMTQCEEVMANMKESDKQRDEAHEQSGSPSSEQRDGCSQTVATLTTSPRIPRSPQQREACVQTMVTSELGELLEDKYSELNDEEFMLATIDHRSRENWSTTASDGGLNPSWLKVIVKRSKKTMRTEAPVTLDWNAPKMSTRRKRPRSPWIQIRSSSAMPKHMLPNVPKSGRPENKFYRVANGSKIPHLGGKKMTLKAKKVATQSMNFRLADMIKALASVNIICQRKNRVVFDEEGSYIDNNALGWNVPMRVKNGVYEIDVHVTDLIDTRVPVFVGPGERR